jgi:acetylornithine deacetylase/succinyl-diaminopimelate desuccinylase-like protein
MPSPVDAVLSTLENAQRQSIARLIDWLKIPSISTDPAYKPQVRQAADWAAAQLRELGFKVDVLDTGKPAGAGHPVVLATIAPAPTYKGAHVLFYGHYDVQPVDPVDLWESPPFEPVIKDASGKKMSVEEAAADMASPATAAHPSPALPSAGRGARIVARGAVDDKGQVMMFIEACRAWKQETGHATGGAAFTVLLEGEEESGSANLEPFVAAHKAALSKCNVVLISDTGMLGRDRPAITYGVRGLTYTEITLHAANQDLHSGLWGGRAPNPNNELAKVLAQLWDSKRRVTIPGFYDDVRELTKGEREAWKKLGVSAAEGLAKIGLPRAADIGEEGYTATEREWARPTAEINGIWGGYTGKGAKTVIPAFASAKVSFRLVADQDPAKITQMFFEWLKERTPPGCRWELSDHHGGFGVTVPTDSPLLAAAAKAIERASGKKPDLIKSGGSIPVAGMLKSMLGLDTIFMGFGLEDDRVHSPNEKFELACFRMGARSHAIFIDELTK